MQTRFKMASFLALLAPFSFQAQAIQTIQEERGHVVYCYLEDGSTDITITNNALDTLSVINMCQDQGGSFLVMDAPAPRLTP